MKLPPKKTHNSHQFKSIKQTSKNNHKHSFTTTSFHSNTQRHHQCIQDRIHPTHTLKVSIQKSQQIGQNQYKKAIKHMQKLNSLQKQSKQKKLNDSLRLTTQHTFKPKINNQSQLNYLYQSISRSAQKIRLRKNSIQKQQNKEKFYNRLIKWGKNHDDRVRDNFVRGKVSQNSPHKSLEQQINLSKQKINKLQNANSSKQKLQKIFLSSLRFSDQNKPPQNKPFINGQQNWYQRQAKAVAIKNGQKYYYSAHIHSTA